MKRAIGTTAAVAVLGTAAAAAPAHTARQAARAAPTIDQLVVFRDGSFRQRRVRDTSATVRVGRRVCTVGQGTPLAALARSRVASLTLHDYGSCSRRAADASGLFVRRLGPDANSGQDGWVYKVGRVAGSAGAGDPSGPFGRGLLRSGAQVLWFYCQMRGSSCQRTLSFTRISAPRRGGLVVQVRAYDDRGRGIPARGVTVHAGAASAVTNRSGVARLNARRGKRTLWADGGPYVRTFNSTVAVR
jgi:hypothetical protein